jgi:hypothetical protein
MKNLQRYLVTLVILTGELIFLSGCQEKIKKDKVPVLYTTEVRDISNSTATCGGTISNDGGSEVTERGVCISTQSFPTTADNVTINEETGTGSFTNDVTGLTANTKYYVRAYATNKPGTSYGNQQSFTTTNNYLLTGTVTDQVTKQPVAGATVYFAGLPFNEEDETLVKIGPYSRSGEDGRYKIFVPVSSFDWVVIRQSTLYPRIYAEKTGYAGSDYPVPDPGVESTITLYHPARLSLRVWNDTITDKIILDLSGK